MTVITKSKIAEKKETSSEKPLFGQTSNSTDNDCVSGYSEFVSNSDVEMWLSPSARRRISTTTTVCVFISALLLMSLGIIGGVYLYREVNKHPHISRFRGWCGIPYERDALHFDEPNHGRLGVNGHFFKESARDALLEHPNVAEHILKENFDIDLEKEEFARIYVPDIGYGRRSQFIHDFKLNKTAIVDLSNGFCFVMPLDRRHIIGPRSLFDLIHQIWMRNPAINTRVVRRTMMVQKPALEDLSSEGPHISQFCASFPTFRLKEMSRRFAVRNKRSAGKAAFDFKVAEFAGNGILEYQIGE